MNKYRFEILFANKNMREVSNFMKKCDLNIGDICIKEIMIFSSEKDLSIAECKVLITQAYLESECDVFRIEGGKVE